MILHSRPKTTAVHVSCLATPSSINTTNRLCLNLKGVINLHEVESPFDFGRGFSYNICLARMLEYIILITNNIKIFFFKACQVYRPPTGSGEMMHLQEVQVLH